MFQANPVTYTMEEKEKIGSCFNTDKVRMADVKEIFPRNETLQHLFAAKYPGMGRKELQKRLYYAARLICQKR